MNSVLAFHEVPDIQWFDDLIQWLQSQYRLLPIEYLKDFYAGGQIRNACHITFDDGHRSFYDVVFPVLQRRRIPVSLFVSPSVCTARTNFWFQDLRWCDERDVRMAAAEALRIPSEALAPFSIASICKTMPLSNVENILRACRSTTGRRLRPENVTTDELRSLAKSGIVTIGAHTLSHPILKNECDNRSEEEIVRSVGDLSALLQHEVKYFAYPNGLPEIDFSEREDAYLAAAGVELAFSTESRGVRANDKRLRIPRIQISPNESIGRIRTKLRFPSAWNMLKKLRPHGEYAERQRLSRMLSSSSRRRQPV